MDATTEKRLRLLALGIEVLPATRTKEVFWPGWSKRDITKEDVLGWENHPDWPNTGMRTTKTPGLDLDIRRPEAVAACERLVRHRLAGQGEILVRIGMAPKRLLPFRTSAPFAKRKLWYRAPDGNRHAIEFLGDGQQAIIDGFHQEAGKPYTWEDGRDPETVPPEQWPEISELAADELLTELDDLLVEDFGFERTAPPGAGNGYSSAAHHVTDVEAALADLDYRGKGGGGNVHDISVGCINRLLVDGTPVEDAIEEVFAARRASAAADPLCARLNWDKIRRRMEKVAYSFINKFPDFAPCLPNDLYAEHDRILRAGGKPELRCDQQSRAWAVVNAMPAEDGPTPAAGAASWPTPYSARPSSAIPRRCWLWGMHYIRGTVTITAAPGATGKLSTAWSKELAWPSAAT